VSERRTNYHSRSATVRKEMEKWRMVSRSDKTCLMSYFGISVANQTDKTISLPLFLFRWRGEEVPKHFCKRLSIFFCRKYHTTWTVPVRNGEEPNKKLKGNGFGGRLAGALAEARVARCCCENYH